MRSAILLLWSAASGCSRAPALVNESADADSGEVPDLTGVGPEAGLPSLAFRGAPRNLLVLSVDTFRRDNMARYGGPVDRTVFLDQLAAEGVALDLHRSCSNWTFPSVVCAMGGRYNIEAGFMPKLSTNYRETAPGDRRTLSTEMAAAGWYTALFTTNGWVDEDWNNDPGYVYQTRTASDNATDAWNEATTHLESAIDPLVDPWFLHVHLKEPHAAYDPPAVYLAGLEGLDPIDYDLTDKELHYEITDDLWDDLSDEERALILEHMLARYDGEVRYLDDQIRAIFAEMDERGWLDDTLVLIFSDHGEQFWEHGEQSHAYTLYRQENDAIAFLWSRGIMPAAWAGPTVHVDLAPTVLAAFELPIPDDMTGLPVGTAPGDRPIFGESVARWQVVQSVTVGASRLVYRWTTGERWLFDLETDPAEESNLYESEPTLAHTLGDFLQPWIDAMVPLAQEHEQVDP